MRRQPPFNLRSLRSFVFLMFAATSLQIPSYADSPSFLRRGDRWVMVGDSITHNDLYRRKVESVFRHFHPDEPLIFSQAGISGVTSEHRFDEAAASEATVVSIMLGMNDFINSDMAFGKDPQPYLNAYRRSMEQKVKEFRGKGAAVLLMSPTKTDPRLDHLLYELRGGETFLDSCASILQEIAAENDEVYYLPVQEEFDRLDRTLGPNQILRPDGVHPSGPGQYQIARTLWNHLNVAGNVRATGPRAIFPVPPPPPLQVTLADTMLKSPGGSLDLILKTDQTLKVQATWSWGTSRGRATIDLAPGETRWRVPLPVDRLEMKPGQLSDVVVDFESDGKRIVHVIDLSCAPVIHAKDGVVAGEIFSNGPRPEGRLMGTWTLRLEGRGLLISGEVIDKSLTGEGDWPWARDGVGIWLDLRPGKRFAGTGIDEDVSFTLLNVIDKPFFGCSLIPWLGRGMILAADHGAERTPTGYKWHLWIHRKFSNHTSADFTNRDFIGLNMVITDEEMGASGRPFVVSGVAFQPGNNAIDKHPNALILVDLGNKISGEQVIHASLF